MPADKLAGKEFKVMFGERCGLVRGVLLCQLALCVISTTPARGEELKKPRKIAVFGSSVAFGSGDHQKRGGYAGRLKALLEPRGWEVVNVSRGGDNTVKIAPRFEADLLPQDAGFVLIGLSLANEGLIGATDAARRDAVYAQWRTGMLELIQRCREAGMRVVVGNCYAQTKFRDHPAMYECTRRMNIEISRWDVPSVNFLGAVDDGAGNWMEHFEADAGHPSGAGHEEMFRAIVPSLFDAIKAGKPVAEKVESRRYVTVEGGTQATAPLCFVAGDPIHAFAVSFWTRPHTDGALATVSGKSVALREEQWERGSKTCRADFFEDAGESIKQTIASRDGSVVLVATDGTEVSHPLPKDSAWHQVVVSHWFARGVSEFYVDGVLAGTVPERMMPVTFFLGGDASPGPAAKADFKEWCVYRSSLNQDQVQFMHDGNLFQSSLEVYAPLADAVFSVGAGVENRAQSMAQVKVIDAGPASHEE